MKKGIEYINPEGLHKNPAFTQVITVSGKVKTIYVGGQNAVNDKGEIVGKGDYKAQTEQVLKNLDTALKAAGASFSDVVKLTIYSVQGQNLYEGFTTYQKYMGTSISNPPAISVLVVAGLANPDFLIEIDAVAVVNE